MKILFVYPEFEVTFWSWIFLLKFVGKKAAFPPLGLLTVAAMLPKAWSKRLIDLNIQKITDKDIAWADYVFIGGMSTQSHSAKEVILRCNNLGTPVVLGGPILENIESCESFPGVSHFILGEVENTLPEFLEDLWAEKAGRIYPAKNFPDVSTSPIPLWELIDIRSYATLMVQFCRACPFNCSFCRIVDINGRIPRPKSPEQFLSELDAIYQTGFRGPIMDASDNIIGKRKNAKEMLRQCAKWQKDRGYPFEFTVEADITLADDPELMDLMVSAGIKKVFLGLETPNKAALEECGKLQNVSHDIVECVRVLRRHGLHPLSGFIVGFDADDPLTFARMMIEFIQETGIVFPMVGILLAPPGTALYAKLKAEGRILPESAGNNIGGVTNIVPKMPLKTLLHGYKQIWKEVYSPGKYYERILVFLEEYNASKKVARKINTRTLITDLRALFLSVVLIGMFGGFETSYYYWKTLLVTFFKNPRAFYDVVALWIYGFHFQRIARHIVMPDHKKISETLKTLGPSQV